jgi:hypothetical protein
MRSNLRSVLVALGVLGGVVLVGLVGVLVLGPGSTKIEVFPAVILGDPPSLGSSETSPAVVIAQNKSGGTSLFGLQFGSETYRVRVEFYTSPGCWPRIDSGDQWPAPFDECSSDVAVKGEVAGLGTAWTGHSIVAVDVEVTHECFDAVSAGDSWPSAARSCLDDSGSGEASVSI